MTGPAPCGATGSTISDGTSPWCGTTTAAAVFPIANLVLWGAYGRGVLERGKTKEAREEHELHAKMIKVGWGRADPIYRRVFTSSLIPGATETQLRWFDELQRQSMLPESALASSEARARVNVESSAPEVTARTLVLHADEDCGTPFEEGRRLAGFIPNARFVSLSSRNHILLEDEPAWKEFITEVVDFAGGNVPPSTPVELTSRELAVLRLIAHGLSNVESARELSIGTRTVERHLSNIYAKLSLSGKSARAAAAVRLADLDRERTDAPASNPKPPTRTA